MEGTTRVREVVSLRYRSVADDVEGVDWAAAEAEIEAEYKERGDPHHWHSDPQWRSITQIARRYTSDERDDLRTARRRVAKILKRLRLKP